MQNHTPESSADLQRYLRSLGELLPASVFAKDLEGRYVYVNARFAHSAELTGHEDALGKLPRQILDPKRARQAEAEDLTVLRAGHPLPLLYRAASGSAARASHHADQGQGALGLLKDYTYRSDTIVLDPGDIVLLHSDGISESTTPFGQQLGIDWICRRLAKGAKQPAAQIVASLLEALDQETDGALDDDVTALALRPVGLG